MHDRFDATFPAVSYTHLVVEFFLFTFLCCRSPADAIHLFHAGGANLQILCRQWVYVKEGDVYKRQIDTQFIKYNLMRL